MINTPKNKIMITIGIFIAFVIIISVIYLAFNNPNNHSSVQPKVTTIIDPGTGETITEVSTKTPETNGRTNNVIVAGTSKLIEMGIEKPQLDNLWSYYNKFANLQNPVIKTISIDINSLKMVDIDSKTGAITMNYRIFLDRDSKKIMYSKIVCSGLKNITLYITNPDGKLVYKSDKF